LTPSAPLARRGRAQKIKSFWTAAGFQVAVEIIQTGSSGNSPTYGIRRDLLNGLPRSWVFPRSTMLSGGNRPPILSINSAIT
jgi:hypothetical protein